MAAAIAIIAAANPAQKVSICEARNRRVNDIDNNLTISETETTKFLDIETKARIQYRRNGYRILGLKSGLVCSLLSNDKKIIKNHILDPTMSTRRNFFQTRVGATTSVLWWQMLG